MMIEKKDDVLSINNDISEAITLDEEPVSPQSVIGLPTSTDITASILAESRQFLDVTISRVQEDIRKSFANLFETLKAREKQLLRQVDVLHNQQVALIQSCQSPHFEQNNGSGPALPRVMVDLDAENYLIKNILSFGNVGLEGGNLVAIEGSTTPYSVPYKLEDYQDADHDHVCLYKPLSNASTPQQEVIKFGFVPKLNLLNKSPNNESNEESNNEEIDENDSPESQSEDVSESEKPDAKERRPSQVQQWLQQIMVETETEPSVGEVEKNFAIISHSQSTSNNSFD